MSGVNLPESPEPSHIRRANRSNIISTNLMPRCCCIPSPQGSYNCPIPLQWSGFNRPYAQGHFAEGTLNSGTLCLKESWTESLRGDESAHSFIDGRKLNSRGVVVIHRDN